MALDATPAGAAANSYLTVAGADALAGDDAAQEAATWTALVNTTPANVARKERALKTATRQIDGHLRTAWPLYDAAAQRLSTRRFPRAIDKDAAGDPIIPRGVELATYQQAIYLVAYEREIASANRRRAQGVQSASEPNLTYTQADEDPVLCAEALHHLSGFAVAPVSGGRGRGVRSPRVASGYGIP